MSVQATAGLGVDCDACSTVGWRIVEIEGNKSRTVGTPVAKAELPLSEALATETPAVDGPAAEGPTVVELAKAAPAGLVNSSGEIDLPSRRRYYAQAPAIPPSICNGVRKASRNLNQETV